MVKWPKDRQKGKNKALNKFLIKKQLTINNTCKIMHIEDSRKEHSPFKTDWLWLPLAPFLIAGVVVFKF